MNSENTYALLQRWQQLSNSPSLHWAQCHCEAARSDSLQRCTLATHLNNSGVSMSLLESKISRETSLRSVPLLRQVLQLKMLHDWGNKSWKKITNARLSRKHCHS